MSLERSKNFQGDRSAWLRGFHGISLIEVLIALIIIAGGLLALSKLQGSLIGGGATAKQQSEAGFIAQRVIEDLRAKGWLHASLTAGNYTLSPHTGQSATYSVEYRVTNAPSGGPEYKTVVVTVKWKDTADQWQYSIITARFQKSGADGTIRILGISSSNCSSGSSGSSASSTSSSSGATTTSCPSTSSSSTSTSSSSSSSSSSSAAAAKK